MAYSVVDCVVCGKRMEMVNHLHNHHCDQRLLNRKDGEAKRDPTPPISRNWVTRFHEGMRLLHSF